MRIDNQAIDVGTVLDALMNGREVSEHNKNVALKSWTKIRKRLEKADETEQELLRIKAANGSLCDAVIALGGAVTGGGS